MPSVYHCVCGPQFIDFDHLMEHVREAHPKELKEYWQCLRCLHELKMFTSFSTHFELLDLHMRSFHKTPFNALQNLMEIREATREATAETSDAGRSIVQRRTDDDVTEQLKPAESEDNETVSRHPSCSRSDINNSTSIADVMANGNDLQKKESLNNPPTSSSTNSNKADDVRVTINCQGPIDVRMITGATENPAENELHEQLEDFLNPSYIGSFFGKPANDEVTGERVDQHAEETKQINVGLPESQSAVCNNDEQSEEPEDVNQQMALEESTEVRIASYLAVFNDELTHEFPQLLLSQVTSSGGHDEASTSKLQIPQPLRETMLSSAMISMEPGSSDYFDADVSLEHQIPQSVSETMLSSTRMPMEPKTSDCVYDVDDSLEQQIPQPLSEMMVSSTTMNSISTEPEPSIRLDETNDSSRSSLSSSATDIMVSSAVLPTDGPSSQKNDSSPSEQRTSLFINDKMDSTAMILAEEEHLGYEDAEHASSLQNEHISPSVFQEQQNPSAEVQFGIDNPPENSVEYRPSSSDQPEAHDNFRSPQETQTVTMSISIEGDANMEVEFESGSEDDPVSPELDENSDGGADQDGSEKETEKPKGKRKIATRVQNEDDGEDEEPVAKKECGDRKVKVNIGRLIGGNNYLKGTAREKANYPQACQKKDCKCREKFALRHVYRHMEEEGLFLFYCQGCGDNIRHLEGPKHMKECKCENKAVRDRRFLLRRQLKAMFKACYPLYFVDDPLPTREQVDRPEFYFVDLD